MEKLSFKELKTFCKHDPRPVTSIFFFSYGEQNRSRVVYHFPKRQILDASKLKEFADENFKFDENGRKFSKRVKNTVGKGKISCKVQFLLFPECFQKTFIAEKLKPGLVLERVKQWIVW